MKQQRSFTLGLILVTLALLTACQPLQPPVPDAGDGTIPAASAQPATIVLPDGMTCAWAGAGATLAFDGKRLNYTCSDSDGTIIGLLGDPTPTAIGYWSVEKATITHGTDGFALDASETVEFLAATLDLADGTQCAFAGEGATMAFDGKRLNYSCPDEEGLTVGLLGDLVAGEAGVLYAEKALIDRSGSEPTVTEATPVAIAQINAAPSEEGATEMGDNTLVGPTWSWQRSELGDGTTVTPADPSRYTVTFVSESEVQVQLDCNRGGGGYTVNGTELTFGALATTLMACPSDSQDSVFGQQLADTTSYALEGDTLILTLSDGGTMTLAPATAGAATAEAEATGTAVLTGTVTYLQRIALLPGAVVDVQMQDGSGAVVATWQMTTAGENVPLPFALAYDPAQIDETETYTLAATITVDGQARWRNAEPVAVLTNGAPTNSVEIIVQPAR